MTNKQTVAIPTYPYGLAQRVERETEANIYGDYIAVHPTFWGPPQAPVKGKQGWRNWSVTFLPEGTLVGTFLYQKTAKKFAETVLQIPRQGTLPGIGRMVLVDLVREFQAGEEA